MKDILTLELLILNTSIYSSSPSHPIRPPKSSLWLPCPLPRPQTPSLSPRPPSLQLGLSLCPRPQWPGARVRCVRRSVPQGNPGRGPPDRPSRSGPHWQPGSGLRNFPCLDVVHEGLHPVKLGSEGAQVLLQGVELLVQVTQCIRQWLDSGEKACMQYCFEV